MGPLDLKELDEWVVVSAAVWVAAWVAVWVVVWVVAWGKELVAASQVALAKL